MASRRCANYSTSNEQQCIYIDGHAHAHRFMPLPVDDQRDAELAQLREEVAKMRPVFEAAVEWRSHHFTAFQISADKLKRAIDAAESGR